MRAVVTISPLSLPSGRAYAGKQEVEFGVGLREYRFRLFLSLVIRAEQETL